MLDNYVTASTSRVKSDKNVPRGKFEELKKTAKKKLSSKAFHSKANLNGVTIELNGNSHHQYEFWQMNWFEGMTPSADARIFSAFGVECVEPAAYYCSETNEPVLFNTEYYGQRKS